MLAFLFICIILLYTTNKEVEIMEREIKLKVIDREPQVTRDLFKKDLEVEGTVDFNTGEVFHQGVAWRIRRDAIRVNGVEVKKWQVCGLGVTLLEVE